MPRKLISSGSEYEAKIGYSRAVVDGDYVFVSGTTGFDYDTMTISENVVEQAQQCFKNIHDALLQPRIRSWTGIEAQEKIVGSRHELR